MDGSIRLSPSGRKALLTVYRSGSGLASRRAHVILLAAEGWSLRDLRNALYVSFDFIVRTIRTFQQQGLDAILPEEPPPPPVPHWAVHVIDWLTKTTPEDFGYFRRRWSCETVAEVLAWRVRVFVSGETVRRVMRRLGFVWRRPRPIVGPVDPQRTIKLKAIQRLLRTLPANETAVFQDEVDLHLNPKIGSCWMKRGQQTEVPTPGNNEKRHLAGSLVWRTGRLVVSPPERRRNTDLFLRHLEELRHRFRHVRKVHVICDNAPFHCSRRVRDYVRQWNHRLELHYLPKYAPETNPIERIWWRMHETITRNHRCPNMEQLVKSVYEWFGSRNSYYDRDLANYLTAA
jgi:putative transposase